MLIIQQHRWHFSGADPASHSHKDVLVLLFQGHVAVPSQKSSHLLGMGIQLFSWIPGAGGHHLECPPGFGGDGRSPPPWCPFGMPSLGLEPRRNPPQCRQPLPDQGSAWKAEQNPEIKISHPAGDSRFSFRSAGFQELKGKTTSPHVKWMSGGRRSL